MSSGIDELKKEIDELRVHFGLVEMSDDRGALAIHIGNRFQIQQATALEHTTESPAAAISGWYVEPTTLTLHVFVSCLEGPATRVIGKSERLVGAAEAIGLIVADQADPSVQTSLPRAMSDAVTRTMTDLREIRLEMVTAVPEREISTSSSFGYLERDIRKTRLHSWSVKQKCKLRLIVSPYSSESHGIPEPRLYRLRSSSTQRFVVAGKPEIQFGLTQLQSLVELLRERGTLLFERNVRMFLGSRDKTRLEHPMVTTLQDIAKGRLDPTVFLALHGGVTLSAADAVSVGDELQLDTPSVINGCQTVSIAERFLQRLESTGNDEELKRFSSINVLTKIVVRPNDAEQRDIANSNNRQNPIEPWQLFCNDPVHVDIELLLKRHGVCYERQVGKFATLSASRKQLAYPNSPTACLTPPVLARVIATSRGRLGLAAKPSEIFSSKEIHDAIFDARTTRSAIEIVWAVNSWRASARALSNYLEKISTHADSQESQAVFAKPLARAAVHYVSLLWLAQRNADQRSRQHRDRLHPKANSALVDHLETVPRLVVSRFKTWYLEVSSDLKRDVAAPKISRFLEDLVVQIRLSPDAASAFSDHPPEWLIDGDVAS